MSVFDTVGVKRHELATIARWRVRAEEAEKCLQQELGGYTPYTGAWVLRELLRSASMGRKDAFIFFPMGTPKEVAEMNRVVEISMEAGITVVLDSSGDGFRCLRFSW